MAFKYKAFISYNHRDSDKAEWLLKKLEAYRIPKQLVGTTTARGIVPERLAPIFRDRDELPAAESLSDRLNEAIAASEYMIVICSPGAAQSQLVNKEILEFKRERGDKNMLALIVAGEPFASDTEKECFPPALRHRNMLAEGSISFAAEGIAADVRAEGDGKRRSILKIVAGMIGVGLDALIRREERRRYKRLAAVLVASVAATLVTGELAYEARTARADAEKAQKVAEGAQKLAEKSMQEAERRLKDSLEISGFLMTTVYEELLGVGNINTLEAIINKTLEPYNFKSIASVPSAQFHHFGGNMMRLGQMFDRQGFSQKARKIFDDALPLMREFDRLHPNDKIGIFRLQNNLFFVGYMAKRQGRFKEAEEAYRERLELARLGQELFPNGSYFSIGEILPFVWIRETADAKVSLASLIYGQTSKQEEALDLISSSIATYNALMEKGAEVSYGLGSAFQYLGDVQRSAGRLNKAMVAYQDRLALFENMLSETDGTNYRLLRRRYTSLQNIGHIQMDRGNYSDAIGTFREAASGFDILVEKDPANTLWLSGSAELYTNLAAAYFAAGDTENSRSALAKARAQSDETMKRDNSRVRRQVTAFEISLLEAELAMRNSDTGAALTQLNNLSAAIAARGEGFLRANGALTVYAKTHLLTGQILAKTKKLDTARAEWQKVTDMLTSTKASLSIGAAASLASANTLLAQHSKTSAPVT